MQTTWLVLLALGGVPEVTAGPDLADQALVVAAPIDRVTVFSDRAQVIRRAEQELPAGIHALRLPDLPGAVGLDTLRVSCTQAKVLRVEATPVDRERTSIEAVDELIRRVEGLTDQLSLIAAESEVHGQLLELVDALTPQPPVAEQERVGRPLPPLVPDLWRKSLDFLQEVRKRTSLRQQELRIRERQLHQDRDALRREVREHDLGGFSERKIQVVALLRATQPVQARVELEYFISGASWRPRYDLRYRPDQGQAVLEFAGQVRQATGEDWNGVLLRLSTAIPGQGIELPELLTWALGEKREYVPQVRAARQPPAPPRFSLPAGRPTPLEQERAARREVLSQRLGELRTLLATGPRDEKSKRRELERPATLDFEEDALNGALGGEELDRAEISTKSLEATLPRPSMAIAPPPPPAAPAPAMMKDATPEPEPERVAEELAEDAPRDRSKKERPAPGRPASTSLSLFDVPSYRVPVPNDPTLPAVLAGGLDHVWESPTRATLPSRGEQQSVPLAAWTLPVTAMYEATPALQEVAYLKAEVPNQGQQPILGGPVNIFSGNDFVGQGQLQTTGPGGKLNLPLGADEDLRLKRTVVPASATEGLLGKTDVTTYTVTLEVGNYKKRPVRIALFDVLPKSGHEDIKIERVRTDPAPAKGPDEDGVIRWELELAAGQTRTVELVYRIRRPQHWQLRQ